MKTTVLDCLPWLADKLTDKELSELDDYVDESIDDAIESIDWCDVECRFGKKISRIIDYAIDEAINGHIAEVVRNIESGNPWRYHNEHNHIGSLSMCKDDVCVMAADLTDALYRV